MNYKNKLRITKLLANITTICVMYFLLSCSESVYESSEVMESMDGLKSSSILQANEFRYIDQKFKISEDIPIWKAQLNKIIENNSLIKQSELEIIDYQYVMDIDSQDELETIKSEMIDNNTFFPLYGDNSAEFTVVEGGVSKSDYKFLLDMLLPNSEYAKNLVPVKSDKSPLSDAVYFFEKNDLGMVNLEWKYKGKVLNTICLVSEKKGIIFDNFLYFIHFVSGKSKSANDVLMAIPRLKLASIESGDIQYTFWEHDQAYNWYGVRVWHYSIQCTVTGSLIGSQKSITDKSMTAFHEAMLGYSCDAKIQSTSFLTGVNGHLDFAWGYSYGTGVSVNVSWNGSAFSISGGGIGATGEEYVSPSELN